MRRVTVIIPSYQRTKRGMKTAQMKIRGYKRPKPRKSRKIERQQQKVKLGVLRDPKTGWLMGSYVIRNSRRRAKNRRRTK
jgi:hypothetical protein